MPLPDLTNPLGRLRFTGMLEGASFLFLLGVAMPLKYAAGLPLFVNTAAGLTACCSSCF